MNLKRFLDSHLEDNGLWSCYIVFGYFFCINERCHFFQAEFQQLKNLNLNSFMLQKKASLPEFIKGSYMVVLTFESACWWNTMVTIQINFLIRQYFNLLRFGFLHFTKWRSEILSNWLRQLLRVKGLHNTSFLQWNCLFNLCMFNRSAR